MPKMKRFEVEGAITLRFTQIVEAEDKGEAMDAFEEGAFPAQSTGFLDISREAWSAEELDDDTEE